MVYPMFALSDSKKEGASTDNVFSFLPEVSTGTVALRRGVSGSAKLGNACPYLTSFWVGMALLRPGGGHHVNYEI